MSEDVSIWQHTWNQFGKLMNIDDLNMYFEIEREYNHKNFFHYTKKDIMRSIISNKQFWISNVTGFNDEIDKKQFGTENDAKYFFSLCFSTGINENLPLWYMYSGMNGEGSRICIPKSAIKKLISPEHIAGLTLCELGKNDKGNMVIKKGTEKKLKCGEYNLCFKDVLYYGNDSETTVAIKYNTMTNYNISIKDFEKYRTDNKGFFKSLIWFYEKETRLIVQLINDGKKYIEPKKSYVITLKINEDVLKRLSIMFAPEVNDDDFEKYKMELTSECPYLKIHKSTYHGTVKMNFCSKCERNRGV